MRSKTIQMREGIPIVIVIFLLSLLRVLVPPLEISYMGYHEGFVESMRNGDRGYLLNCGNQIHR